MFTKHLYRVKNWPEYNKALIARGSLTLWFDENSLRAWKDRDSYGKKGRNKVYSDLAIEICMTLKTLWRMTLRSCQGYLQSLFKWGKVDLPIPHYTTLSRRAAGLKPNLKITPSEAPRHLVIDSTGLRIYGEGEWKVRKFGFSKRRTWRKLHLAIDAKTHEIVASTLTKSATHDGSQVPYLLPKEMKIASVRADGAYDTAKVYQAVTACHAQAIIPPRNGAIPWGDDELYTQARSQNVLECIHWGMANWKKYHRYGLRSLAETAMYRQKQLLGPSLSSRKDATQITEHIIRASILNRLTQLGMPVSEKIA